MNHEFWYLSRAAGFTAYLLLFASVALGIGVSTRIGKRLIRQNALFDIHRFLAILGLLFTLFHVYVLLGDGYFNYNVWQLTLPFLSPYRMWPIAVGSFALYASVIVVVSFYVRRFIGYRAWRAVHFVTFALYAGATLHGITAGSDTSEAWARAIYLLTGGVVLALLAYRLQNRMPASASMQWLRLSAGGAAVVTAIVLVFGTGLLSGKSTSATSDAAVSSTGTGNGQYSFLPSFDSNISGTYTQSGDSDSPHLVMQGTTSGDLSAKLEIELASDGSDRRGASVTHNQVELMDPASGAVLCNGQLTTFDDNRAQITCDGEGPFHGVRMTLQAQFNAANDGTFTGALSGEMSRTS